MRCMSVANNRSTSSMRHGRGGSSAIARASVARARSARYRRSTRPPARAARKRPASVGPASTSTSLHSRLAQLREHVLQVDVPLGVQPGAATIRRRRPKRVARAFDDVCSAARENERLARRPKMRAAGGIRSLESSTARSGWRVEQPIADRARRAVGRRPARCRCPSGRRRARARRRCTSARAASPVIHWLAPFGQRRARRRGSRASLTLHPRPAARHARDEAGVRARALRRSSTPPSPRCPPPRAARMPPPFTRGFGSSVAHTTRRMPAAINASAQGGVRP